MRASDRNAITHMEISRLASEGKVYRIKLRSYFYFPMDSSSRQAPSYTYVHAASINIALTSSIYLRPTGSIYRVYRMHCDGIARIDAIDAFSVLREKTSSCGTHVTHETPDLLSCFSLIFSSGKYHSAVAMPCM